MSVLVNPWPWYVAGPLIGLVVPVLLLLGNRPFGVSGSLRALCAAVLPADCEFLRFDWRRAGGWNLAFAAGITLGGFLAAQIFHPGTPAIAASTREAIAALGVHEVSGFVPPEVFSWGSLLTLRGFVSMVVGGLLVGFGTAYAGGCTSGHGVAGLASFQLPSLIAVIGFFAGGLAGTFLVFPLVF